MKALLLRLAPRALKDKLKELLEYTSALFINVFSINGFSASVYYLLFNRSFYREHRASLLGRKSFQHKLTQVNQSSALLRRNIHRLEKGLIMRPRRASFAEGFILETVIIFDLARVKNDFCKSEIQWAQDVLITYFAAVQDEGRIAKARTLFNAIPLINQEADISKSIPYAHRSLPASPVDYPQILSLFTRRRSVRWYQERTVNLAELQKAAAAASLAPSACNRQPFFFSYSNDPVKATEIAQYAMGTVGFAENIQAIVVVVGDLSNYPSERDRHVIYIDASLAAMQFMLSLETQGLSSCPINWPDLEEREQMMQKKLGLAYHERPVMLIAVGYALSEGEIPFSQKKSADMLLKEIV